jgi:hypothetical protein
MKERLGQFMAFNCIGAVTSFYFPVIYSLEAAQEDDPVIEEHYAFLQIFSSSST